MKLLLASFIACLACYPGMVYGQTKSKGLRCEKEGYHAKIQELDFVRAMDKDHKLNSIPAKFPKGSEMNVAALWLHLNARLAQEHAGTEIVFETNLSPEEALNSLRKMPIETVYEYTLNEKQLRDALARSSCEDLLAIIMENTAYWWVIGEKEIVIGKPPKKRVKRTD